MSAKHEPAMTRSGGTARSLAQLVPKLARAVMGKRGFAEAGLLSDWQAVVGADIAAKALPERLDFPRGERRDGTLHLSVTGAWALALQHLEPQLVERINSYFGYPAVARLKLHQVAMPPQRELRGAPPRGRAAGRRRGRRCGGCDGGPRGRGECACGDRESGPPRRAPALEPRLAAARHAGQEERSVRGTLIHRNLGSAGAGSACGAPRGCPILTISSS